MLLSEENCGTKRYILSKKIGSFISISWWAKGKTKTQQQKPIEETQRGFVGNASYKRSQMGSSSRRKKQKSLIMPSVLYGALKKTTGFGIKRLRFKLGKIQNHGVDETTIGSNQGDEEAELCKKRILMGGKCRPLNNSGVLHYDENGIFLPEDAQFC